MIDHTHLLSLYNVLAMGVHQAPGLPLGSHAHFIKHRIDSLTVRGVHDPRVAEGRMSQSFIEMKNMGRALEGTFRSVNNLLETLHHSEFFYFTAATWKFISIGRYMPLLALLISPLILEISSSLYFCSPHTHSQFTHSATPTRIHHPHTFSVHLYLPPTHTHTHIRHPLAHSPPTPHPLHSCCSSAYLSICWGCP